MGAWALGAWGVGAWAGTAWAETPEVDHGGGYGPIIRWRHHDDEGDIIAVIAAFVQSQED